MRKVPFELSIAANYPEIASEWNDERNGALQPTEISKGSHVKAWWKCQHGHVYDAAVKQRVKGSGCPYCAGKRVCQENCLQTVLPNIAKEWNQQKNTLSPREVTSGSKKKIWWTCPNDHDYLASISGRKRGRGCPYCANLKIGKDNCLAAKHPTLESEWDMERNEDLTPYNVPSGTNKKIWWTCNQGHSYQMTVYNRVKANGCPICLNVVPHPSYNLKFVNPSLSNEWHPEKNGQLTPLEILPNSNKKAWWKCTKGHEWETVISNRNKGIGCPYCSNKRACLDNCLSTVRPDLALDWDFEKNTGLKPTDVLPFSNKLVWWRCPEGHSYRTRIADRTQKGSGCKICFEFSGSSFPQFSLYFYILKFFPNAEHRKLIVCGDQTLEADIFLPSNKTVIEYDGRHWHKGKEKKDIEKNMQFLKKGYSVIRIREQPLSELEGSKNLLFKPSDLSSYAQMIAEVYKLLGLKKKLVEFFTYEDLFNIRQSFYQVKRGNSVASTVPHLLKNWHPVKNAGLSPNFVSAGSNIQIFWLCDKGHEYKMSVKERIRGRGCPFCSGKRVNETNSFAAVYPELLSEWDKEKNSLSPHKVSTGSKKKVWWRCQKGADHLWTAPIYSRKQSGCPFCSGKRVSMTNNLEVTHPELASEWHPKKNGALTPIDVTKGMGKIVWWQCINGHEWKESLNQRSSKKTHCRICKRLKG